MRTKWDIDSLLIPGGEDFYIVIGPQIAFGLNTIALDDGTTEFRSYINFNGYNWVNEENGDICLRAGGKLICCGNVISICVFTSDQHFFHEREASISRLGNGISYRLLSS